MDKKSFVRVVIWMSVILDLIILDQVTKVIAFKISPVRFSEFLSLEHFYNNAFAFSLPVPIPLAYCIYAIVLGSLIYYLYKNYPRISKLEGFAWAAILAGALSNVGERIIFGSVKDFIGIGTGVFNFADLYIMIGAVVLLIFNRPSR